MRKEASMARNPAAAKPAPNVRATVGETEWNARVDLAAAYRLGALFGWSNLIYNHVTLRVPGEPHHFLIKVNDLMFEEVTASSLAKIDLDGKPVGEDQNVNVAGFNIHTAVLRARPEINSVYHVHTDAGTAMSAHKGGLLPMSQTAMNFYNRLAYHDYEGLSDDEDERERIARDLGTKKAMILRNHGLLTCGTSVSEAIVLMKWLVTSCETQLRLEATGAKIILPPPEVCEHTARQWEMFAPINVDVEWGALLRMADRHDPSFRD
jgi:ribulose-5-phosphate 4-epimerase/fuculose-1-phosphate aldolase